MILMSDFLLPETDTVTYDYWFTSSSDRALSFLEDFAKMNDNLGELVEFKPHYVFWECINCDQEYLQNDSFGAGRYCALEPSNANIRGEEIVLEDLRQMCLWDILKESGNSQGWWDYIRKIHQTCYSVINSDCSERAHELLGYNFAETEACVSASFSEEDWKSDAVHNIKIDGEIAYWKEYGTNIYPSVVINKKTYRGQIEPLSVYNALCAGFTNPPAQCLKTLHIKKEVEVMVDGGDLDNVSVGAIIAAVVGLIIINVVIVYCCRRRAKREMANEMQMQIESAVSQYFALTQKETTNTNSTDANKL